MKMKNDIRSQVDAELSEVTWSMRDQYAVLNRIKKGGHEPVKKKVSLAAILVIAALAVGAAAAVAEMLGFNVFELFGKTDERYKEIAPYTILEQTSKVSVTTVKLGTTVASINSAFYDGHSLLVGYAIQNGSLAEEFTPDDALLGNMIKTDDASTLSTISDSEQALVEKWMKAIVGGTPMGIAIYDTYPGDHTVTDDGTDIPPYLEETRTGEDGIEYTIREYESPLEEALRNLDHLTLNIRLYQSVCYYYFDGTDVYAYRERRELEPMKATVWNNNTQTHTFAGSGQYSGLDYEVTVHASAVYAQLEMSFEGESFPKLPDVDHWYELQLTDENGSVLRITEYDDTQLGHMRFMYEGTGRAPSELTLRIYIGHEGDFDEEAAIREAQPVVLKLQE